MNEVNLVPSLLQAIVNIDGEALVMHAGDKPYVVSPTGQVELASRGLTLDAVSGIVTQLLPIEFQNALDEFGAVQYALPPQAEFPHEQFTVVVARGGDDVWAEIRRKRVPEDDLVPEELFVATPAPASAVAAAAPPAATLSTDDDLVLAAEASASHTAVEGDLSLPTESSLWPGLAPNDADPASYGDEIELTLPQEEPAAPHHPEAHAASVPPPPPEVIEAPAAPAAAAPPPPSEAIEAPAAIAPPTLSEVIEVIEVLAALDASRPPPLTEVTAPLAAFAPPPPPEVIEVLAAPAATIAPPSPSYDDEIELELSQEEPAELDNTEALAASTPSSPPEVVELSAPLASIAPPSPPEELELPAPLATIAPPSPPEEIEPPAPLATIGPPSSPEELELPTPLAAIAPPEAPEVIELAAPLVAIAPPSPPEEIELPAPLAAIAPPLPPEEIEPPAPLAAIAPPSPPEEIEPPAPLAAIAPPSPPEEVELPAPLAAITPPSPPEEIELPAPLAAITPPSPPEEIELPAPLAAITPPSPPEEIELPAPLAAITPPSPPEEIELPAPLAAITPPSPPEEIELPAPLVAITPPSPPEEIELPAPLVAIAPPSPPEEIELPAPLAAIAPPSPPEEIELPAPLAAIAPPSPPEELEPPAPLAAIAPPAPPVANLPTPMEPPVPAPPARQGAPALRGDEPPVWQVSPQPAPQPPAIEPPPDRPHLSSPASAEAASGQPAWQGPPPPAPQPAVVLQMQRSPVRFEGPSRPADDTWSGLERLLRTAASRAASALYLSSDAKPSVRVDGELQSLDGEPVHTSSDVVSLLLTLMPDRSHEALRTGATTEWICDIEDIGRVRCMSFSDHRGPGGVFRLMPVRSVSVDQLGLTREIQSLAIEPEGLVLISGSRSSGKRTLISSLVDLINRTRRDHVITIEREVNIVHDRGSSFISQREVRGGDDEVLAAARAALREDPDVLVLDQIRTGLLMNVALEAAASGHLVIGGFSAHNATESIDRIIDLYAPEFARQVQLALADNLRGVVSQILLPRASGGGRVAAREVLLNTPAVAGVIAAGKTSQLPMAIEAGRRLGMSPLNDALLGYVQSGAVDVREAYRYVSDRPAFIALLKRQGVDTSACERIG